MITDEPGVPGPHQYERPNVVSGPVVRRTSTWATVGAVLGLLINLGLEHPEIWSQLDTSNSTLATVAKAMPFLLSLVGAYIGSKQGANEAAKHVTPVDDPATYSADLGRLERLVPYSDLLRAIETARKQPPLPRRNPGEGWEDVPPFAKRPIRDDPQA